MRSSRLGLAILVVAILSGIATTLVLSSAGREPRRARHAHPRPPTRDQASNQDLSLSLCGPECLAELLRREGRGVSLASLASEMRTEEAGTSLLQLANVARRHGFSPKGLELTYDALTRQPLPLIAFISPGHYVIVDKAGPRGVTVWDPSGAGLNQPAILHHTRAQWLRVWSGIALTLH